MNKYPQLSRLDPRAVQDLVAAVLDHNDSTRLLSLFVASRVDVDHVGVTDDHRIAATKANLDVLASDILRFVASIWGLKRNRWNWARRRGVYATTMLDQKEVDNHCSTGTMYVRFHSEIRLPCVNRFRRVMHASGELHKSKRD